MGAILPGMTNRKKKLLEEGNPEFARLRRLTAEREEAQAKADLLGRQQRGEAARLVRKGKTERLRGMAPAVARVAEWTREYADRLSKMVDDEGNPLVDPDEEEEERAA